MGCDVGSVAMAVAAGFIALPFKSGTLDGLRGSLFGARVAGLLVQRRTSKLDGMVHICTKECK